MRTLVESGGRVLAVEAERTIMLDREEIVRFANRHGLTIVSVDELASYRRSLAPDGADRLAKDGA